MPLLPHQERAQICGFRLPQYFWFVISGAICDVIQALLDYLISLLYIFEWEKSTICWTVSYILSISVRHTSHRYIVFGEPEGTYWASLMRTYLAYSSSIVFSIFANSLLVSMGGLSHKEAWIVTMLITGAFNYFALKASWRPVDKSAEKDKAMADFAPPSAGLPSTSKLTV